MVTLVNASATEEDETAVFSDQSSVQTGQFSSAKGFAKCSPTGVQKHNQTII